MGQKTIMEDFFRIGAVTTAHGVKGELKVFPTTDDPQRYKKLKTVYVETKKERKLFKVLGVKFFKQFVILKLEGIDTMDDALLYKNADLLVERKDAIKCKEDEYFLSDLIGLNVIDEDDKPLGTLTEVYQTGANDVYEITVSPEETFLLPAIKQCVLCVNIPEKYMKVHVLPGLRKS